MVLFRGEAEEKRQRDACKTKDESTKFVRM